MNAERLVKATAAAQGLTLSQVAERFGTSQQNFSKRLHVGRFTLSEWEQIADALGCKLYFGFELPDGRMI